MSTKQSLRKRSPNGSAMLAMKRMRDDLLMWICERHAMNNPLSRDSLRSKALELSKEFGLIDFKCSEQWITTFLKTHGFSPNLTCCDGPVFDDYRVWVNLLRPVLNQYKYKDLFHVDELAMYSNVPPTSVLSVMKQGILHESHKSQLDQITMLLCCNSSGTEKLPPVICGPKECQSSQNDCVYYRDEDSRISDEAFVAWLSKFNERLVLENRKALLLLQRSRIRATSGIDLSNISLLFLPKDFPPHLRPLRREIFHYVKMMYRQQYARKTKELQLQWDVDRSIDMLLHSWKRVPRELIISSFQRTTFRRDDYFLEFPNPDFWSSLKAGVSFRKFISFDDELSDAISSRSFFKLYNKEPTEPRLYYDLRSRSKVHLMICLDDEKEEDLSVKSLNINITSKENKTNDLADSQKINNDITNQESDGKSDSIRSILDDSPDEALLSPTLIQRTNIDYQDSNAANVNPGHSSVISHGDNFESATLLKKTPDSSILCTIDVFGVINAISKKQDGQGDVGDRPNISPSEINRNNETRIDEQENPTGENVRGHPSYSGKRKNKEYNEEECNNDSEMGMEKEEDQNVRHGAKRQRTENNWAEKYQTKRVFGSLSPRVTKRSQETQTWSETDTDCTDSRNFHNPFFTS